MKNQERSEGYIYTVYRDPKYLKHVLASLSTLRRYDAARPVALFCDPPIQNYISENNLSGFFYRILPLVDSFASIIGFKHNVHKHLVFDRNLFIDSDIIWCKNPDPLWQAFSPYPFTITGAHVADCFFGAPKDAAILFDLILQKRRRTLRHFGLTHLSRVQSGMIYAQDKQLTEKVCLAAHEMYDRRAETHFQSRVTESGRSEDSCEWSLAMAMSKLSVPVFPWFQGQNSPQLDYMSHLCEHDADFTKVRYKFYFNETVYNFRGLKNKLLRESLIGLYSLFSGNGDYIVTTPYSLHFGWYHEKKPFLDFSERNWERIVVKQTESVS